MIPIISDLISNTVGKVVGKLADHFLPESMSEKEKEQFKLEAEKILLEENKLFAEQLTAQMETINQTMREEAKSEHWAQWLWRPLVGFTFCVVIINNYILVGYLKQYGIQTIDIPGEVWNAILVILGAASAMRGWKQVEEAKKK